MGRKRKLTPAEKREKKRRRERYETIFVGGKQKRVKRIQPLIEGIPQDEFIRRNADPIWLHKNEMWELMTDDQTTDDGEVDINDYLDLSSAFRPGQEQKRVNVDFPVWMIDRLDREANRLGVPRQSLIKVWIGEHLETSKAKKRKAIKAG